VKLTRRLAVAPVLALALGGLATSAAHADSAPLTQETIDALAEANCQLDPASPLSALDMNPVVVGQSDLVVIPDEITAHFYRVDVTTSLGDLQECTFGVLHRDALLPQVQYEGSVTLELGDGTTVDPTSTDVEIGNMGQGSPVDPTTEVVIPGFVLPLDAVTTDPTFTISLDRKALEVVPIAVNRTVHDAADKLLKEQVKAAAQLQKKQLRAAKSKHSAKAVAAAKRSYDKRIAAAQAAHDRATTPKTVTRPVSHQFDVPGSIAITP